MPTQRPRLTITLTPQLERSLSSFTKATGVSRSAFIVQCLEQALPVLERVAVAAQAIKRGHPEALKAFSSGLSRFEGIAGLAEGALSSSLDLFLPVEATGTRASSASPLAGGSPSAMKAQPSSTVPPPPDRGGRKPTGGGSTGHSAGSGKVTSIRKGGGSRAR